MKMLMLFARNYWLKPYEQNLDSAPDPGTGFTCKEAVLALIHIEACDEERKSKCITKGIKQIKWLARKFESQTVILHSFAHLSTSHAPPQLARSMIEEMQQRLSDANYEVRVTPFGYFNEFDVHVGGPSLAKVFVDI